MEPQISELEEFREEWRNEVSTKLQPEIGKGSTSKAFYQSPSLTSYPSYSISKDIEVRGIKSESLLNLGSEDKNTGETSTQNIPSCYNETLVTALDHYELAVKRENDGNMGESLYLYRKAFRMDHKVDRKYKNKFFPTETSVKAVDLMHIQDKKTKLSNEALPNTNELIASFSGLSIQAITLDNEDIVVSCPLAKLPDEILVHILTAIAISDVASFVRTAQVCKKMAYMVVTEQQIWKRICTGSEFGFGAMHYEWQPKTLGGPFHKNNIDFKTQDQERNTLSRDNITEILLHKYYSSSWCEMFRLRPRIRFHGCYISTVNYLRPGEASSSQVSWNSPILIVTYYRYLRFFRDGTVISLLTTNEPVDVVPFLTRQNLETRQSAAPKFMQQALRGRWHLAKFSSFHNIKTSNRINDENDVFIETEGVNQKYLYQLKLSLLSTNRACKNNKLIWQYFRSFNRLTNEIDQFSTKEEKAFFWSRVKSYANE
ncbi:F-box protein pof7 [Erysiphe neolycopersici]|uniref:F-box protein pof7 n=1 Tax=Erysiphe neolycopersici TaxID=212602 RepID=A0A420I5G5_9PEZI|nr:F-box protein pof7 [Erysiphe neolycopersici]